MAAGMELGRIIQTKEDIEGIKDVAERQFAALLLPHPHLRLIYEPRVFERIVFEDGKEKKEATVPDFLVVNRQSGSETYVEITKAKHRHGDPKKKQRQIMEDAAPDVRYVVLYSKHLKNMQRRNPGTNFFDDKKTNGHQKAA